MDIRPMVHQYEILFVFLCFQIYYSFDNAMIRKSNIVIKNKRANFDYEILDRYTAGIQLFGTEIKSIREGKVNIKDSYAIIRNNEIYLLNTHISTYKEGNIFTNSLKT